MSKFKFGVIADVQYADVNNGWDFHHTQRRWYRESRDSMIMALNDFNEHKIDFILQLGDLLDGKCQNNQYKIIEQLYNDLKSINIPIFNCIGNHELYNFSKDELGKILNMKKWYYSYKPANDWKIIVLDCYGFSTLHQPTYDDALQYLIKRNPNDVTKNVDWLSGLNGLDLRFVPYNGSIDKLQLEWLKNELNCDDKIIISSHIPLQPGSCAPETLLWNYDEVLNILWNSKANIVLALAGHDHDGGYYYDKDHNIHYITMQSPMTCRNLNHDKAHSIITVYNKYIDIQGYGSVQSYKINL